MQFKETKTKSTIRNIFFISIIYLAFIALGLPDTGFGVAWNEIRLEFKVPLEYAGAVTMIVTIFSALSGLLSGYFLNRFGTGKVTAFSCLLTAIAIIGYTFSETYWSLLLLAIPLGFGAGAVDSGLNSYVAENLSAKHMNWLHGAWGIGATLSPLIITSGITVFKSWRYGYGIIGTVVLLLSIIIIISLPMWKTTDKKKKELELHEEKPLIKGLAPILSVATFIIYVGIEAGLGLWLSALLIESRGLDIKFSGIIVGVYFGSITVGRFLMGFIADKLGNRRLINIGLVVAFVGSLAFLVKNQPVVYSIGIFLIGFGFAPLYPSLMHETSNRYGNRQAKKIIGNQVAFSYISTLGFVPLLGFVASHISLEIIPVVAIISIIVLGMAIRKLNKLT